MTNDLVKRLRNNCSCNCPNTLCGAEKECRNDFEAADRIEKLEAALRDIVNISPFTTPEGDSDMMELVDCIFAANNIARKALEDTQ